jgi:large subunit ribosomal protein L4
MKIKIYTNKGQVKEDFTLPKEMEVKGGSKLLKQAIRVLEDNTHFGLNKVKTRSEVNITKKKIYKQKGTGGARHGAKSAHIFVGGGVVHGPTGLKRVLSLSQKMRNKAKLVALNLAIKQGKLVLVETLEKLNKTKDVNTLVLNVRKESKKNGKALLVLANENKETRRYARNIKDLIVIDYNTLNVLNIVTSSLIIIDSNVFETKKETKGVKKEKITKIEKKNK